jgi:hypothetical protein
MIDEKQNDNAENFNYLGSVITNDARWTLEITYRIVMTTASFNKKKIFCNSKLDLNLRKELVKCYIWSIILHGAET